MAPQQRTILCSLLLLLGCSYAVMQLSPACAMDQSASIPTHVSISRETPRCAPHAGGVLQQQSSGCGSLPDIDSTLVTSSSAGLQVARKLSTASSGGRSIDSASLQDLTGAGSGSVDRTLASTIPNPLMDLPTIPTTAQASAQLGTLPGQGAAHTTTIPPAMPPPSSSHQQPLSPPGQLQHQVPRRSSSSSTSTPVYAAAPNQKLPQQQKGEMVSITNMS